MARTTGTTRTTGTDLIEREANALETAVAHLGNLDTPTLRTELAKSLTVTAKSLAYAAAVYQELTRRGEDLSGLRSGIAAYLPQVASGTLDAELVVRFAGQKMLLDSMAKLPPVQQKQIIESGTIDVVSLDEGGNKVITPTPPQRLGAAQLRTVFGEHGIRSADEQYLVIAGTRYPRGGTRPGMGAKKVGPAGKKRYPRARRVELNREDSSLTISDSSVTIEKVVELVGDFYGVDLAKMLSERNSKNGNE